MLQAFLNIFRVPDLRNRVLFTLGCLVIYRIGFWIPLAGVDQQALVDAAENAASEQNAFGAILNYASIFSGGSFSQSTIFGLGIMPYITASIIFQLLQSAVPAIKKLKEEGASGQQKITEWTRYATVGMCLIQAMMWMRFMKESGMVYGSIIDQPQMNLLFNISGVIGLTAGSLFLMWLGEQIDKYGIGNGVSLILTAGIIAQMDEAVLWVVNEFSLSSLNDEKSMGPAQVLFLTASFVFIVAGAILITVAQRRIPIQQARHTRGRKVAGGGRHYLPLRVNHAGVMPIIFASSLMIFPSAAFTYLQGAAFSSDWPSWVQKSTTFMSDSLASGAYPNIVLQILMIYFFSYFWTTIVFSPDDMAKQLKDSGSFIPGLRPGPRTAEYLETVVERITYAGAGFLAIIAIIPTIVSAEFGIPMQVSSFLGGTGLLIVVSVGLDLVQRIEANLLMRNYAGFLNSEEDGGKAPKVRSGRN